MKIDLLKLDDDQLNKLIEARWTSSAELWETVERTYKANVNTYSNQGDWINNLPFIRRKWTVHANRIFVNMEAVINSLIANPPGINILPARDGETAQEFARKLESFFRKKYLDLNIKEIMRMGLRNLYFGRLIVIKAFWNPKINDFDFRAIDPRKVRVGKYARKECDSEFAIEEIEDNLLAVCDRFPKKKTELMQKFGLTDEAQLLIKNPDITYKEAWIGEYVILKFQNIILDKIKNPYWDWDGILITDEEASQLDGETALEGDQRRQTLQNIKIQQKQRKDELAQNAVQQPEQPQQPQENQGEQPEQPEEPTPPKYKPYFFNYFDYPRKPYIYATTFNNENTPIGRTDMITLSAELQRGIDKRKMDIDENCELVNGIIKVDASVMGKSDAQRIRFETKGIIWGKGVVNGVAREVGQALPEMVFKDMQDSRSEIDNIMAATSAFRGEQQGVETKAGRLALIQQSFLRLNELVQVGDYVAKEIFDWGMQLAKTRYTEYHYAKWMGKEGAREVIELIQDDFETGSEVKIIAGKSLPVDDEFKFEQAQTDFKQGALGLTDYLERVNYEDAKTIAKNAVMYHMSPIHAVGFTQEELQQIPPPLPQSRLTERVDYKDLPPAAKVQWLARQGIQVQPTDIPEQGELNPVSIAFKDLTPDLQAQVAKQQGWQPNDMILAAKATQENEMAKAKHKLEVQAPVNPEPLPSKK